MLGIHENIFLLREENTLLNPLQYSCLENPMDRGACWAAVPQIAESNMTDLAQHSMRGCCQFHAENPWQNPDSNAGRLT